MSLQLVAAGAAIYSAAGLGSLFIPAVIAGRSLPSVLLSFISTSAGIAAGLAPEPLASGLSQSLPLLDWEKATFSDTLNYQNPKEKLIELKKRQELQKQRESFKKIAENEKSK